MPPSNKFIRLRTDGRDLPRYPRLIIGVPWYIRLKVSGERGRETVADSASQPQPTIRTAAPFFCAIRYNCRGLVTFAVAGPAVRYLVCTLPVPRSLVPRRLPQRDEARGREGRDAQRAEDQKRGAQCRLSPQLRIFLSSNRLKPEADSTGTGRGVIFFISLGQGTRADILSINVLWPWFIIWPFPILI